MGVIRGWLETECLQCQRKLVGVRFRTRRGGSLHSVSLSSEIPRLRIWQVLEVCLGSRGQPHGRASHRQLVAIKTQCANSGVFENGRSSMNVFWCCCWSIFFFGQYCTECLVRGIADLTYCSCFCIFMFKSSLRRMEGMTKLTEKSKLKLAVKQCRRSCNSAWLSEKMADEIQNW